MRCYHCMNELKQITSFCPYCGCEPLQQNAIHRLSSGTVLHGRYLIGSTLGEGGFGITYVGFDQTLFIKVAVKEYYPSGIASRVNTVSNDVSVNLDKNENLFQHGKESFLQEARSIAKFSLERGIVDIRDFFTENGTAYIVMEYLDGLNLGEYITKNGVIDAGIVFDIMQPLMRSLDKMHREDVIHRDISPDNIMRLNDGTLKLMDFGAARQFSRNESVSLSVVLKPGFAPCEQYSRRGKQGPWTDVYALCATIYKCITGKTPVDSLDRMINDDLKKPSELGIAISKNLDTALMKGLAIRPEDRFQSMGELINAIKNEPKAEPAKVVNKADVEIDENATVSADDLSAQVENNIKKIREEQSREESRQEIIVAYRKRRNIKAYIISIVLFLIILGVAYSLFSYIYSTEKKEFEALKSDADSEYSSEYSSEYEEEITYNVNGEIKTWGELSVFVPEGMEIYEATSYNETEPCAVNIFETGNKSNYYTIYLNRHEEIIKEDIDEIQDLFPEAEQINFYAGVSWKGVSYIEGATNRFTIYGYVDGRLVEIYGSGFEYYSETTNRVISSISFS